MMCHSWLIVFQNWDHRPSIFSVLFIVLYSTVESGVWRWNFHLFCLLNFGVVELLLQDDLSTGHKAGEHRFDSWNWSQQAQKSVAKEARIRLECFHIGKWLRIACFPILVFPIIPVFPWTRIS